MKNDQNEQEIIKDSDITISEGSVITGSVVKLKSSIIQNAGAFILDMVGGNTIINERR